MRAGVQRSRRPLVVVADQGFAFTDDSCAVRRVALVLNEWQDVKHLGCLSSNLALECPGHTLIRKPAYTTFMPRRTTIFTDEELAHARGRQDAWDVLQTKDREEIGNGDEVVLHPREEWVLHQHRDAYLDGAAAVLGYKPHLVI